MKTVYFVRHAESEANADPNLRTISVASIPLTEKGRAHAKALAHDISFSADLVVVSPFLRTKETALPYLHAHKLNNIEEWAVQEFTFLHQAKHNGTTTEERRSFAEAYWDRSDPYYKDGEDSESFDEFVKRVLSIRERLILRNEESIIIFSHGYFMRAFMFLNDVILQGVLIDEKVKRECLLDITPNTAHYISKIKSAVLYTMKV